MSIAFLETPATEAGAPVVENNFKVLLPSPKAYTIRCIDSKFGKSKVKSDGSGGDPMITLSWEIIAPEKVMIKDPNNQTEKIAVGILGIRITTWHVLTAKTAKWVKELCARLSIDPMTLDDENPNITQFLGKIDKAILKSSVEFMKDQETGEFILDSQGEKKVTYQHSFVEWV